MNDANRGAGEREKKNGTGNNSVSAVPAAAVLQIIIFQLAVESLILYVTPFVQFPQVNFSTFPFYMRALLIIRSIKFPRLSER